MLARVYRRARLAALAGGGVFGFVVGSAAASSFPSAARSGSKRGAWGNRSSSMARRMAAVTAASSSAGRSIVGMARDITTRRAPDRRHNGLTRSLRAVASQSSIASALASPSTVCRSASTPLPSNSGAKSKEAKDV
jgi:hypothetical protein